MRWLTGSRLAAVCSESSARLLGSGGWVLLLALPLGNAANFGFHAMASRLLGPSSYGALNALLVLLLTLSVPLTAVQTALTREIVTRREGGEVVCLGATLRRAMVLSALGAAALLVAAPAVKSYLRLQSAWPAVVLAGYIVVTVGGVVPRAWLMAQLRFRDVGMALAVGTAMRLAFGTLIVGQGGGVTGAMVATLAGEAVSTGFLLWRTRPALRAPGGPVGLAARDAILVASAFLGVWLFVGLDVILVRHYLAPSAAGRFSAAATVARSVLFVSQPVALIALPRFASGLEREARTMLRLAVAGTFVLAVVAGGALLLVQGTVLRILFGTQYTVAVMVLPVLVTGSVALALINVVVNYLVARRANPAPIIAVAVLLALVVSAWLHTSGIEIAALMTATAGLTLLALLVRCRKPATQLDRRQTAAVFRDGDGGEVDLTVVVPFYNPGPGVRDHVLHLVEALRGEGVGFEVIAVSDGCTDGSAAMVTALDLPELRCLTFERNEGKGEALRVGFVEARGRYLGFIDADGDLDPSLWHPFLELMQLYQADIVLGSKRHLLSEVQYPATRRVYSWGYQQLIRALFRIRIRDTQTGIKLIRREVLADVLPLMREHRFAFDLELFVVARRCGWRRFLEAPVRIERRFGSTVSARSAAQTLIDTLAVAWRLHVQHAYDPLARPVIGRVSLRSRATTAIPEPRSLAKVNG